MSAAQVSERPVFAAKSERPAVRHLDACLWQTQVGTTTLVGASGETIRLPDSVQKLLVDIVHALAQGSGVTVIPVGTELTTQQAAEMVNVSRPYLVGLLEDGKIPFRKVGTHRRILVEDLVKYKSERDRERTQKLKQLSAEAQELGLYD